MQVSLHCCRRVKPYSRMMRLASVLALATNAREQSPTTLPSLLRALTLRVTFDAITLCRTSTAAVQHGRIRCIFCSTGNGV
jgi:hypothetical protein